MALYVAYLKFKPGTNALQGLAAFERRKTFEHPRAGTVLGEYWVNAPEDQPQVVVIWEAEDEGPGDYYEAAWGDSSTSRYRPRRARSRRFPGDVARRALSRL